MSVRLCNVLAILDVGHGNSAVLLAGEDVVVFDVGLGSGLLEFLCDQDIRRIRTVVLSHADADHIGATSQLLASKIVQVERVVVNSDALKGSATWDDLLWELNQAHRCGKVQFCVGMVAGDREEYADGSLSAQVLAPSRYLAGKGAGNTDRQGRRIVSNSISAVVRLCRGDQPLVILPGDLDSIGLDGLLDAESCLDTPVLVFPHHGARPGGEKTASFVRRLCDAVRPDTVVFSIGRGHHATPNPDIVAAVRRTLPSVRIICTQLSEHCASSLPAVSPEYLGRAFALGREDRRCCGGTVIIDLGDPASVLPGPEDHGAFVAAWAKSALCRGRLPSASAGEP